MICFRYLVRGRVQGVFYRASTQEQARALGLTGWVRNCSDGSVELVACGEESVLKDLESWLWQGPRFADVHEVDRQPCNEQFPDPGNFSVRY